MIKRLLIANRGEIACRVIQTARRLGITTVAIYSEADANAKHVTLADEAYCVGPAPSKDSYLQYERILTLAKDKAIDAIHPGYGFLSENADFARACQDQGIVFVGPSADAITAMGSKSHAKALMHDAGVPLVRGYHGEAQDEATLRKEAERIGYPLLLKASSGGGGKGMRVVESSDEFSEALASAKREALSSFGDSHMLIEQYLTTPRHVEIQVFCDTNGNGVYLFERDCSIQRRHQKIVEEAPAPDLSDKVRKQMGQAALAAAKAIDYVGAGTVEFLYDEGEFFFMEMNTRLQVEHPVTEMITGTDLVEWQLKVAQGEALPCEQADLAVNGHAIEVRVYAEDPDNHFLPQIGTLTHYHEANAPHVRFDSGVNEHAEVSMHYDPMIAKVIAWGETREAARTRLLAALKDWRCLGVKTNQTFLQRVLQAPDFIEAKLTTRFLENNAERIAKCTQDIHHLLLNAAAVALARSQVSQASSPWEANNYWQMNLPSTQELCLTLGEQVHTLSLTHITGTHFSVTLDGKLFDCHYQVDDNTITLQTAQGASRVKYTLTEQQLYLHTDELVRLGLPGKDVMASAHNDDSAALTAPMPGTVTAIMVKQTDEVRKGAPLLVIEAMKMEHTIKAPYDGKVTKLVLSIGDLVQEGKQLIELEAL